MANLKDNYSSALVARLGAGVQQAWPEFPAQRFVHLATDGLENRELKARVALIADALIATMPDAFAEAAVVVDRLAELPALDGWASLPVNEFVARAGRDHPDLALPLLAKLTPKFSSEFAIRPFVEAHPAITMRYLKLWVRHGDDHVRRLVSEGTRPRLPWAPVLRGFVADPSSTVPLLDQLFDDESEFVRRSVANHLNDISKDHPQRAIEVARRWLASSTHGDFVVRHGLRTLVKKGDPGALALLGFDGDHEIELSALTWEPQRIPIGGSVRFEFALTSKRSARAVIDYVVHYQGAAGAKAGKVFKGAVRHLAAGQPVAIERTQRFVDVSIRRIRPGPHRIDIQVNGRILGGFDVDVEEPGH